MNRKNGYISLLLFLCLICFSVGASDFIDYHLHSQATFSLTLIVYVIVFSLFQINIKNSLWEKAITGFLAPFVIYVLSGPVGFVVTKTLPGYADFYQHLSGEPSGGWLWLIILVWSWFLGALALIFAVLKIVIDIFLKLNKKA